MNEIATIYGVHKQSLHYVKHILYAFFTKPLQNFHGEAFLFLQKWRSGGSTAGKVRSSSYGQEGWKQDLNPGQPDCRIYVTIDTLKNFQYKLIIGAVGFQSQLRSAFSRL